MEEPGFKFRLYCFPHITQPPVYLAAVWEMILHSSLDKSTVILFQIYWMSLAGDIPRCPGWLLPWLPLLVVWPRAVSDALNWTAERQDLWLPSALLINKATPRTFGMQILVSLCLFPGVVPRRGDLLLLLVLVTKKTRHSLAPLKLAYAYVMQVGDRVHSWAWSDISPKSTCWPRQTPALWESWPEYTQNIKV